MLEPASVTRLGDLLHFGQLFKAGGNNCFGQIAHIVKQFWKGVKIIHFSSEIICEQLFKTFGNFLLVTLIGPGPVPTSRIGRIKELIF